MTVSKLWGLGRGFAVLWLMLVGLMVGSAAGLNELVVKWTINTSDVFAPLVFGGGHLGCQTVWDVDGDGVKELVFGTRRGSSRRIWCFDALGRFRWIFPPLNEAGLLGDPTSKVSIVDVDGDGVYELCFSGRGGRLYVLRGDGSLAWYWDDPNIGSDIYGPPQAFDVDGDGLVEFFLYDSWGALYRLDHLGRIVWSVKVGSGGTAQPTIADVDRDGRYELLLTSEDHFVRCLDAGSGFEKWRFDTGGPMEGVPVVVADVNKDGDYEVLVWGDDTAYRPGAVFCLTFAGSPLWEWEIPCEAIDISSSIRLAQVLGDVDLDGNLDMVLMSGVGVFCIDVSGDQATFKWGVNLSAWSEEGILPGGVEASCYSSYQLIADVDGDEHLEVLMQVPFPVVVDASDGEPEAYYVNDYVFLRKPAANGGWWGDVDDDGRSEWVCELEGSFPKTQVYCLTLNGSFPAASPWPEFYHSAYPGWYQREQDWLTLKGAYSNSLWFPLVMSGENLVASSMVSLYLLFRFGCILRRGGKLTF